MKAYKNIQGTSDAVKFKINDVCFYEAELSTDEEKLINDGDLHNKYYVLYEWEWECHADNDGGIDSFQFGEEKHELYAQDSILFDGAVIGFYTCSRVFLFDGRTSLPGAGAHENVGGWGDISSDSSYTLMKK